MTYFNNSLHSFDLDYNYSLIEEDGIIYDLSYNRFFGQYINCDADSNEELNLEEQNMMTVYSRSVDDDNITYCENAFFFKNINYTYYFDSLIDTCLDEQSKKSASAFTAILSYYLICYGHEIMPPYYESRAEFLGDLIPSKNVGTNFMNWVSPHISDLALHIVNSGCFGGPFWDSFYSYSNLANSSGAILTSERAIGLGLESSQNSSCGIWFSYEDGLGVELDTGYIIPWQYSSRPLIDSVIMRLYFDAFLVDYVNEYLIERHRPLLFKELDRYGIAYGTYIDDSGDIFLLCNVVGGDNQEGVQVNTDTDLSVDINNFDEYHLELMSFVPNYYNLYNDDFIPAYFSLNTNNNFDIFGTNISGSFSSINNSSHYRIINNTYYLESHNFINFLNYRRCSCCGLTIHNNGIEDNPNI